MELNVLEDILTNQLGAESAAGALSLPDGRRVTLLIETGDGIMPVGRVRSVELGETYVTVTTEEQRYFLDPNVLFAVRQDDIEERAAESRPGFHRG